MLRTYRNYTASVSDVCEGTSGCNEFNVLHQHVTDIECEYTPITAGKGTERGVV